MTQGISHSKSKIVSERKHWLKRKKKQPVESVNLLIWGWCFFLFCFSNPASFSLYVLTSLNPLELLVKNWNPMKYAWFNFLIIQEKKHPESLGVWTRRCPDFSFLHDSAGVFSIPLSSVRVLKLTETSHRFLTLPYPPSLFSFLSLKLLHQPFLWAFSLSLYILLLWEISRSLPSVFSPLHLSASFLPRSSPPRLLVRCHLRSISSLLPPCVCSHFLTLPRTRHTQPCDDPQEDSR